MILEFSLVPYGLLTSTLHTLGVYLQKSELWTKGRASIDDIVGFLYRGQMQLWAAYDPETNAVYGYVITEIKQYPAMKVLVMQYIAGESHIMNSVQDKVHETLERYAVDAGCKAIEAFGRPGWRPNMKKHGYTTETVIYEKYL
jgi:hypothetical protein